ncbi:MAG: HNH endonuclease signature motif containing protein, partial [Ferruginibacter sp.]
RSPSGYVFVIDGSHRLSSLYAWINDDFGDGKISKMFYDGIIPEDQIHLGEETKKLIRKRIGSYEDFKLALTNPEKVKPVIIKRAKNLSALAIQLQWVEGDANKAESSFFKINQQAAPINKTELILLESRKKPNCIAARAIIRSGKGHKYWSGFTPENQLKVQELAKEINAILFAPPLQTPIKTLDIPIGGKVYSAQTLPLILDFVNIVNSVGSDFKESLPDDATGDITIKYLEKSRKVAYRINSNHPSSLGLHPIVYFYSQDGRHKVASFFATVAFVMEVETKNLYIEFIEVRSSFEYFLLKYDYIIQQIVRRYRSAFSSYPYIKEFYFAVISELRKEASTIEKVAEVLVKTEKYNYLSLLTEKEIITSNEFSTERKSAVYINEAILAAPKCKICHGYIHRNSISIDHITRKQDGGLGSVDNGQLTHPYCNTTLKN